MPLDRVVVNASPLLVLFKSGQAELLPQLFGEILVPQAVWNEVMAAQMTQRPNNCLLQPGLRLWMWRWTARSQAGI